MKQHRLIRITKRSNCVRTWSNNKKNTSLDY